MRRFADAVDTLNRWIGETVSWFTLAIVLLQFAVVVMRYVFGVGSVAMQESLVYLFGLLFTLAAAWTLALDAHVRVDMLYRPASARAKAAIDLAGTLLLLLPMTALVLAVGFPYVARSWAILETSKETSGLPFVYVLKTGILAFGALTLLQGLAEAIRAGAALAGNADELARFERKAG